MPGAWNSAEGVSQTTLCDVKIFCLIYSHDSIKSGHPASEPSLGNWS